MPPSDVVCICGHEILDHRLEPGKPWFCPQCQEKRGDGTRFCRTINLDDDEPIQEAEEEADGS